jgi:release factor glutamine methyltransferase
MLPTPSTRHVDFDTVYEPAEDSFLLIDTLSSTSEIAFLSQRFHKTATPVVLEVGTGSGVVIAFTTTWAKKIIGRRDVLGLGIDVNRFACVATSKTAQDEIKSTKESGSAGHESGVFGDTVMSDLTSCLRSHVIDILLFNPPYVPTEDLPALPEHESAASSVSKFDRDSHMLALSYAGGLDGMETTNRLLSQLPSILRPKYGVAYVLLCAQNKPEEVKARIRNWDGEWKAETVGDSGKQAGWEKLQIVRIWREIDGRV